MKVYVISCVNSSSGDESIEDIFSSKEKAKKYMLEEFTDAVYDKEFDIYDYDNFYYEIQEWEVK